MPGSPSNVPSRTLIAPFVGCRLQSALPQTEQKHFAKPSSGTHSETSSSPEVTRSDPGATRA
jgi:hypothetical protein